MTESVVQLALFGGDADIAALEPIRRVWRPLQVPLSAKTVARFWTKVVITPTHFWFRSAVSNPDGYGRNRAELHRITHSTVCHYRPMMHAGQTPRLHRCTRTPA
ncbi:hypothetical protein [Rhodococcus sp. H29-C3]|uniref:hypothetical protein n=1 Tax=Rhodococcus sp. H29-C3 TaxID=3046307 RepID=UPI0024B95CF5|nr:hypothetical protein [Rhodococcus sp. H29-C3]MDJ0363269.1 hypothetical protein [Rhodococcus sp. H29-C3]